MNTDHEPGAEEERQRLLREVRQRLQVLRIAGVDRMPRPPEAPRKAKKVESAPIAPVARPQAAVPAPKAAPPPTPPVLGTAGSLFGAGPTRAPALPVAEREALLKELDAQVACCTRCPKLVASRSRTVFGEGGAAARLMFIGEGPGADEDASGRPFVGRAGQLLTDMITKGMGLRREDVYIANIVKCRPPGNRDPEPDESRNCFPYLERQIEIVQPEFLCLLGRVATSVLLDTALPVGKLRKRWHRYQGTPAIVTWHPAYLLRNPAAKKDTWEDLQMLMQAMGIKPPGR